MPHGVDFDQQESGQGGSHSETPDSSPQLRLGTFMWSPQGSLTWWSRPFLLVGPQLAQNRPFCVCFSSASIPLSLHVSALGFPPPPGKTSRHKLCLLLFREKGLRLGAPGGSH